MVHKMPSTIKDHQRIVFELPSCVWADRIFLTGDFNEWDEQSLPMRQGRDGVWRVEIDLPTGSRYEFRYLVDGNWQTDFHADGFVGNQFGSQNSIVIVDAPKQEPIANEQSNLLREKTISFNPRTAVPPTVYKVPATHATPYKSPHNLSSAA